MATLVRQKKFKKRKRNNFRRKLNRTRLVYPTVNISIKRLRVIILVVIFVYGLFFIINNTIFKAENYIEQITYSKSSVDNYDNPYLYKRISELIKYENYFVVSKLRKIGIESKIKNEFPLVKDVEIIQPEKYTASVKIEFYEPDIIIKLDKRKFGVVWEYNFEIFSWNKIGKDIFFVELPQYASWIDTLNWLFFEISEREFIYDMDIIAQWFPSYKRIVYLPWSSRTRSGLFLNIGKSFLYGMCLILFKLLSDYYFIILQWSQISYS